MPTKIIDINEATIKSYVESLRPEDLEIRKQIDIGYAYDGKSVILFQIRPKWDNPKEKLQIDFAKITRIKSKKIWKLYWMRASGKWELYEPFSESTHLNEIVAIIKKDKHSCFFG
ncbi:DUF3024 domain-containing protein [Polaribacter sp. R2A056_3_33]|jgi:hypothetical protein|uniref:DUF3024 domain-containing protein n=1 Tax=unclassified Polaribacter TaxID=196858 RepID=UPI001C4E98F0|nr:MULTISPECIES: DUF3024 domain-containing protein [unclassified Polaribacter]QXP62272.1 DUF3024 domain-containing protein [Polaribacter sp. HaHaR_3_91]QXP70199.1 DUF3024 domain-containing protein [Polaribacter sp. R2A056_3_33]